MAEGLRTRLGTVRARTTLAACAAVGMALVVAAVAMVVVLRRSLVANLDAAAGARAADIAAQAAQGPLPATLAVRGREEALVQVVDTNGRVMASSPNLDGRDAITRLRPGATTPRTATLRDVRIGDDDEEFRIVALAAQSREGPVAIYVASSLDAVEESLSAVRGILLGGVPALLGVVGATAWFVVGRALRPVEAIRAQVADISGQALSRRVPEPRVDDEVARLARTMNAMLDRLQSAAERQRRFVGDASHELQSPIDATRAELEVTLAHPAKADWPATAKSVLDENERMGRLVQDLLFLARADEGRAPMGPTVQVDLDDIVLAEAARARRPGRTPLDTAAVSAAEVRGRPDELTRVVRNLLENAQRHAGTEVTVSLHDLGHEVVLVVADDGPGVPDEDRERIFDRFARLDDARGRETGGSGLGLAIAREVVSGHGGRIWVDGDASGHGARFVVVLPSSP